MNRDNAAIRADRARDPPEACGDGANRPARGQPVGGGNGRTVSAAESRAAANDLALNGPFAVTKAIAVQDRQHPEYDPIGERLGAFLVLPRLEVDTTFVDNVFADQTAPKADARFDFKPSLRLQSDWNQNAITVSASGDIQTYATHATENNNQYRVAMDGKINVFHTLAVTGGLAQSRQLLRRESDSYARFSVIPLMFDTLGANIRATETWNALRVTVGVNYAVFHYEDGLTSKAVLIRQSSLDRESVIGSFKADYVFSRAVNFRLQETISSTNLNSNLKSHQEFETLFGPNFLIGHFMTAEIGIGYLAARFGVPQAVSVGEFTEQVKINYYVDELITLGLSANQAVVDSGVKSSPAYLSQSVAVEANYELLRNLLITAKMTADWNKYRVVDRRDRYFGASLGARYRVSRALTLGLNYAHTERGSSGAFAGQTFAENVLGLAVTVSR